MAFGSEFEAQLISRFLRSRKFFLTYGSIMKENYFEVQVHRDLFSIAKEYYSKYSDTLEYEVTKNEIRKILELSRRKDNEEVFKQRSELYFEIVDKLFEIDLSSGTEYSANEVVSYAKRQETIRILKEAAEKISRGSDAGLLSSDIAKVESMGSFEALGYDYFVEVASRTYLYDRPGRIVSTGFVSLNRFLGGGLAGTELGLIVGPPSRGKTAALVNLAVGAVLNRKNVLYFVLEGSKDDLAIRFDMRISRTSKDLLLAKSSEVLDFVQYFSRLTKSKLLIQMFPTETVTVKDLDEFLIQKEMVDNFIPDLIVIDYLNLCKRSSKEDIWMGRSYREGKALAVKRNIPVWSAVQANMGSLKSDIITPKMIAEATGRIWADADVIVGLCQSEQEEQKKPPEMRLYLGKNRNRSARKIIPLIFDPDLMLMEERKV